MHTYEKPEIEIIEFEVPDIIAVNPSIVDDNGFGPVVKV